MLINVILSYLRVLFDRNDLKKMMGGGIFNINLVIFFWYLGYNYKYWMLL